jgi:hypothetical protein
LPSAPWSTVPVSAGSSPRVPSWLAFSLGALAGRLYRDRFSVPSSADVITNNDETAYKAPLTTTSSNRDSVELEPGSCAGPHSLWDSWLRGWSGVRRGPEGPAPLGRLGRRRTSGLGCGGRRRFWGRRSDLPEERRRGRAAHTGVDVGGPDAVGDGLRASRKVTALNHPDLGTTDIVPAGWLHLRRRPCRPPETFSFRRPRPQRRWGRCSASPRER